jgi:hypothetical protein
VDFYNKLEEAFLKFRDAEKAIKSSETIRTDVYTVAINQLRYASNHLITYIQQLKNNDNDGAEESLKKYSRHCSRALYDAYDSEATFILKEYALFCKYARERGIVISSLFNDKFESWSTNSKKLASFVKEGQFEVATKNEKYEHIKTLLKKCEDCGLYDLAWAYDKVNDAIREQNNIKTENRSLKSIAKWSLIVMVITVLVAFAGLVFPEEFKNLKCGVVSCDQVKKN